MTAFQYRARAAQDWEKRSNQSGSQYAGFAKDEYKTFSVKKENWVRILPPTWPDPRHYGFDLWVHYGVGPNGGTVICIRKMQNKACPVCEAQAKAESAGNEDQARELKPTRRVLVWIIDRNAQKEEDKVAQLWAMPWTVDRDISKVCKDRTTGELFQIDHPEAGFDVTFDREGEGMNVKYVGIQLARRPSAVEAKFLEYVEKNPIPDTLLWRDYSEINALFQGEAPPPVDAPVATGVTQMAAAVAPGTAVQPGPMFNVTGAAATAPSVAPTPPLAVAAAAPVPPPAPVAFVSTWLDSACPACGQRQYTASPTSITCQNGHVQEQLPFVAPPPPPPVAVAPPPPPAPVASPAPVAAVPAPPPPDAVSAGPAPTAEVSGRAAALRNRFSTGK